MFIGVCARVMVFSFASLAQTVISFGCMILLSSLLLVHSAIIQIWYFYLLILDDYPSFFHVSDQQSNKHG